MNNVKTIKETVEFIRSDTFDNLSIDQLIDIIPTFGLNDEVIEEQPTHLTEYFGKGIKMWQYPIQIAPFLQWLKTVKVNSYLEIGVRWGGNFIVLSEVLKKNNPQIQLYACDLSSPSDILNEYKNYSEYSYLGMSSTSDSFKSIVNQNAIEMVYIDGDHLYDGCWADYQLFKNNPNTKYIIFHDIDSVACPDVVKIWNEVKNDPQFDSIEFIKQYPVELIPWKSKYLGIGVLVRK